MVVSVQDHGGTVVRADLTRHRLGSALCFGTGCRCFTSKGIVGPHFGVGYAIGWGTAIAAPATIVAICSMALYILLTLIDMLRWL